MYTLEQLESKTFGELKKIGYELNVRPEGDRRCRQSWVNAIAGVNPPLLQLLEVSPVASVEQVQEAIEVQEPPIESKFGRIVYPKPAAKPIAQNEEARPLFYRTDSADRHNLGSHPTESDRDSSSAKTETLGSQKGDRVLAVARHCETDQGRFLPDQSIKLVNLTEADRLENEPKMSQSAIESVTEIEPPVLASERMDLNSEVSQWLLSTAILEVENSVLCSQTFSKGDRVRVNFGRFLGAIGRVLNQERYVAVQFDIPVCGAGSPFLARATFFSPHQLTLVETPPGVEVDRAQYPIARAAKNSPGVKRKNSTAHQLLELFKSSAHIIPNSPAGENEAKVRQSAIGQTESDLAGCTFSPEFLARYSPPQSQILHFQSDAKGQLSLLDFDVESTDEPPDPDDFESLDAFRKAMASWDLEHPSSSDHCSDHLPSSVQNEPPDPEKFDSMFAFWAAYDTWDKLSDDDSEPISVQNEPSSVQNEPISVQNEHLEISLDSFCEWAPCPADWYESNTLLEKSKVSELLLAEENSITSDFFIPTFDRLDDRRSDEPPDTGIFAKLPGPKPPKFPPRASQPNSGQVSQASRNDPETIPKQFHCSVPGSSTQLARSPPGGDA